MNGRSLVLITKYWKLWLMFNVHFHVQFSTQISLIRELFTSILYYLCHVTAQIISLIMFSVRWMTTIFLKTDGGPGYWGDVDHGSYMDTDIYSHWRPGLLDVLTHLLSTLNWIGLALETILQHNTLTSIITLNTQCVT